MVAVELSSSITLITVTGSVIAVWQSAWMHQTKRDHCPSCLLSVHFRYQRANPTGVAHLICLIWELIIMSVLCRLLRSWPVKLIACWFNHQLLFSFREVHWIQNWLISMNVLNLNEIIQLATWLKCQIKVATLLSCLWSFYHDNLPFINFSAEGSSILMFRLRFLRESVTRLLELHLHTCICLALRWL